MKIFEEMRNMGTLDNIRLIHALPKIDYDDLIKLEAICNTHPHIAQDLIVKLVRYTAPAFYREVRNVLKTYNIIPKEDTTIITKIDKDIITDKIH